MVLAVLVLSLAGLRFADTAPSARLIGTAGEIAATIRHMKTLAEASGEDERFVIDFDAKRYGIEGRSTRAIPKEISVAAEDPLKGEVRSGKYLILFSAEGSMDGGSLILSYRHKSMSILTDPIFGAQVERQ
jgi:hypothetical protein